MFLFLELCNLPGGVFRAMDEDVTVGMLHGYRKKWRKLNDASEHLAMDSEQHVSFDDDVLTTDHVDSSVLNSNPASTLEPAVTQLDSFFGPGLGVDPQLSGNERNSDYEPSVAQSSFGVLPGIDQGGLSSKQDDKCCNHRHLHPWCQVLSYYNALGNSSYESDFW